MGVRGSATNGANGVEGVTHVTGCVGGQRAGVVTLGLQALKGLLKPAFSTESTVKEKSQGRIQDGDGIGESYTHILPSPNWN